ncbi:hypothetical protein [Martelella mangrovi]|uniref:Uncharacterized protein n=1 Tax=Martelella mangrovi TaxID=1397477 RepID=A0ABV2IIR6_9HYPH
MGLVSGFVGSAEDQLTGPFVLVHETRSIPAARSQLLSVFAHAGNDRSSGAPLLRLNEQ